MTGKIKTVVQPKKDVNYVWTCDFCGKESKTKKISDIHELKCNKNLKNKVPLKSFKQSLKLLFLNKKFFIFLLLFFIGNFFLYNQYTQALKYFAFNIKNFVSPDTINIHPIDLLADKFNGETGTYYQGYSFSFLFLFIFLEGFIIYSIFKYRKTIKKKIIFLYVIFLQFLLITPIVIITISPSWLFSTITQQADREIKSSVELLNNTTERDKAGILSSTETITKKIETSTLDNFNIIESNPQKGAILSFLKISQQNKDTFYRAIAIPYQLNLQENQKEVLNSTLLYFPDNTLVVNKVDKKDIEILLPVLVNKMLLIEFKSLLSSKKNPNILFLNEIDYIVYQTKQEEKNKKKFEDYIVYLNNFIKESDNIIQSNQNTINSYPSDKQKYQKEYEDYMSRWGGWYQSCISDLGNDPICEDGKNKFDQNINILKQNIQLVEDYKIQAENNLKLQTSYKSISINDLVIAKRNYQDFLKNPITAGVQDGVFNPPNNIYIKFYEKEYNPLIYYLNTSLHEYLHFYAYNTNYTLEPFLDEGLTDYLKAIIESKYIEKNYITVNYPHEISIVEDLVKSISIEKIIPLYFEQNNTGLQKAIVNTYRNIDYKNFISKGKNLFYTPNNEIDIGDTYLMEIKNMLSETVVN